MIPQNTRSQFHLVKASPIMHDGDQIEVNIENRDGIVIVRPIGDIDLGRSPALRQHLNNAQSHKPSKLIIDLAEVPYMDSSGVATLIEAMQDARKADTHLILCSLQEKVRSIFEIARLDMVFTIVDTTEEAINN